MLKIVALLFLFTSFLHAEKMDINTHTMVINKLETSLNNGARTANLTLRIADLYSERARLKFMKEEDKNCNGCLGSKADRSQAIKYYNSFLNFKVNNATQVSKVMTQIAHLYNLTNKQQKAIQLFTRIIKTRSFPSVIKSNATVALADIYYIQHKYKKALKYYKQSLRFKNEEQNLYAKYRISWSQFNLGQIKNSIKTGFKNLQSSVIANYPNLHLDQAKSMVSFLTPYNYSVSHLRLLDNTSPNSTSESNLLLLAKESFRVGKLNESKMAWYYIDGKYSNKKNQLTAQVYLASISYKSGQKPQVSKHLDRVATLWTSNNCVKSKACADEQALLIKIYKDWTDAIRSKRSKQYLSMLNVYNVIFPDNLDLIYKQASLADSSGRINESVKFYKKSISLAKTKLNSKLTDKEAKNYTQLLESSLLAVIKILEKTQSPNRIAAYDSYLKDSKTKSKYIDVLYQKAYFLYSTKKYKSAVEEFNKVLNFESRNNSIKLKSAHLILDSYNLQNDHESLQNTAVKFSVRFPQDRRNFINIKNTSILKQATLVTKKRDSKKYERTGAYVSIDTLNQEELIKLRGIVRDLFYVLDTRYAGSLKGVTFNFRNESWAGDNAVVAGKSSLDINMNKSNVIEYILAALQSKDELFRRNKYIDDLEKKVRKKFKNIRWLVVYGDVDKDQAILALGILFNQPDNFFNENPIDTIRIVDKAPSDTLKLIRSDLYLIANEDIVEQLESLKTLD
ncbi:hypothetical protein N9W41_00895 [bacterium]|nr:hypothetical protein [bacterium]